MDRVIYQVYERPDWAVSLIRVRRDETGQSDISGIGETRWVIVTYQGKERPGWVDSQIRDRKDQTG